MLPPAIQPTIVISFYWDISSDAGVSIKNSRETIKALSLPLSLYLVISVTLFSWIENSFTSAAQKFQQELQIELEIFVISETKTGAPWKPTKKLKSKRDKTP